MSNHSLKGLYEVKLSADRRAIVFSVSNNEVPLKYDYYMLLVDIDENSMTKISNPLLLAKNKNYNIHRISKDSETYQRYANHFDVYHTKTAKPKTSAEHLKPKFIKKLALKK